MSYVRCVYVGCEKTSRDVSVFRFPVNDEERLSLWIRHSGNLFLDSLTKDELRCRFICADHFDESVIHKGIMRNRLIGPAVPVHYQKAGVVEQPSTSAHAQETKDMEIDAPPSPAVLKVKTPSKFYRKKNRTSSEEFCERSSPADVVHSMPSTPTTHVSRGCNFEGPKRRLSQRCLFENNPTDTPKRASLKEKARSSLRKNKALQAQIRRLQAKMQHNENIIRLNDIESEASKTLVKMQLRKKDDKSKWAKDARKFCLSLFYKSPSAYMHLLRQDIRLAAPSTLRKWLAKTSTPPGISKEIFYNIKEKFEHSSFLERACVVSFDEMSIMRSLEYSKTPDCIEGLEDYGGGHRTNKIAKYVLVFVVRGLYKPWKMPIAYFLSSGNVKAEMLKLFVKSIINKLFENGLLPKAIVCDQMSTNQTLYKNLGVSIDFPFFFVNEKKVYAFFDFPHLVKNIRNNLMSNDFIYGDKIISFDDIIQTYELDKKSTKSRCLLKITDRHISPNPFQKMNVSLATQVLSNSVAAAIRTAKSTGELKSHSANDTAKFVEIVNNLFDAFNSKSKYDKNPHRFGLSKTSSYVINSINVGIEVFAGIKKKKIRKTKKDVKLVMTRPPCFDGIVQNCKAVLQLFDEESTDNIDFLITNRLNQDVCENLFARFRQKSGSNRNPTAKQLRTIFRSSIVNSLIKLPSSKNCEDDDGTFIECPTNVQPMPSKTSEETTAQPSCSNKTPSRRILLSEVETSTQQVQCSEQSDDHEPATLEHCSVTYFAGYLAMHLLKNNVCDICYQTLQKTEAFLNSEKELLILNKSFSFNKTIKLKMPSDNLIKLVSLALDAFNLDFEKMLHYINLKSQLSKHIMQFLSSEAAELLNFTCYDHIVSIINQLIIVKVNFYCKTSKLDVLDKSKMHPKLRILKNK